MNIEQRIINKSAEMYVRLGFKSVTMDDIAAEMGISKKTIYQHFRNKRAIVKATTKALITRLGDGVAKIISQKLNPIEELLTIQDFMQSNLNDESSATFHQLQKFYPQLYFAFLTKQFHQMNDWLNVNHQRGIEMGFYRKDLHKELICRFFIIGAKGIKELKQFEPIDLDEKKIQYYHLKYHLQAICTPAGINFLNSTIKLKQL